MVKWKCFFSDGSVLEEIDFYNNINEFPFNRKDDMVFISLECSDSSCYGIDLLTGEFVINGSAVGVSKMLGKRMIEISGRRLLYNKGVLQYKEAFLAPGQCNYNPTYHYIGYEVDITSLNVEYDKCVVTIRVDYNHKPYFGIDFVRTDNL